VASAKFRGTVTNADSLGGVAAANYLRSDANDSTNSSFTIANDTGLILGAGSDVTMSLSSDNLTIANTTQDKDIIFTVNDGGVAKTLMTLDGSTGLLELPLVGDITVKGAAVIEGNLEVKGTQTTFNTTTLTIEDNIIELNRNISSNSAMPNYSGVKVNRGNTSTATEQDLFWVWDETFADDGTTIHGNAGGAWTAFKSSDAVFGVVSSSPAYLMNAEAGNNDTHPAIALTGRVPVKVRGTGKAGDRIVSAGSGEARVAAEDEATTFNTLGRLIKDKYNEETALTECVIGVK
jgi:hypothetical protein